jgi:metal-responsive CopG/Arc/MetJ family transcriptional regulator
MTRVSVSLPEELVKIIDKERGDVPRSRYLLRLIERKNSDIGDDL